MRGWLFKSSIVDINSSAVWRGFPKTADVTSPLSSPTGFPAGDHFPPNPFLLDHWLGCFEICCEPGTANESFRQTGVKNGADHRLQVTRRNIPGRILKPADAGSTGLQADRWQAAVSSSSTFSSFNVCGRRRLSVPAFARISLKAVCSKEESKRARRFS